MKALLLIILSSIFLLVHSQEDEVVIDVSTNSFSIGSYPSYKVHIPLARSKDVVRDWQKVLRSGKSRIEKDEIEINAFNTYKQFISDKNINIYTRILDAENGVNMFALFEIDSAIVGEEHMPQSFEKAGLFLKDFAKESYISAIKAELKEEEKLLSDLEAGLYNLEKAEERMVDLTEQNERKIKNLQSDIAYNKTDQNRMLQTIEKQKDLLVSIPYTKEEERKLAERELKKYENDLKRLERDQENFYREINRCESKISEVEREQKSNLRKQEFKRSEIKAQDKEVLSIRITLQRVRTGS